MCANTHMQEHPQQSMAKSHTHTGTLHTYTEFEYSESASTTTSQVLAIHARQLMRMSILIGVGTHKILQMSR